MGFALLAIALGSLGMPHYRRHGWAYYLPDRVLVWAYPRFDPPRRVRPWGPITRPIQMEIRYRLLDENMSAGSRRALLDLIKGWIGEDVTPQHRREAFMFLSDLHPESIELLDRTIELHPSLIGEPSMSALFVIAHYAWDDPRAEEYVEQLLEDLDPQSDDVFGLAYGLPKDGPDVERTVAVLARLVEERSANWGNVAIELALIGPPARDALPALRDAAIGQSAWSPSSAAIAVITGEAESFNEFDSRFLFDADPTVRLNCLELFGNYKHGRDNLSKNTVEAIHAALLNETDSEVLGQLVVLVGWTPALGNLMKDDLKRIAHNESLPTEVRENAAWALDSLRYPNARFFR